MTAFGINEFSLPYKGKVPSASSSVGTGLQLTFGGLFTLSHSLPLDGSEVFVGCSDVLRGSLPNNLLDSKRINGSQSFSRFAVTIPTTIIDDTIVTVTLYRSLDAGQTYAAVGSVDLSQGTQADEATFGPTAFPDGTLFCTGWKTNGNNFACGATATLS